MTRPSSPLSPVIWGVFSFAVVAACGERPVRSVTHEGSERSAAFVAPFGSASTSTPSTPPSEPATSPAPRDPSADARLALPIPPREHAPEAPPAGWCGETAIQEGLLHLGVWAPQRVINKAGRPTHPDLYAPDIPVALSELGVRHSFYAGSRGDGMFEPWIRRALDEGDPVLAGVKILPTIHPEWGLDHFVLVVGYGDKGLLVNTTWGHRLWVADTTTPGLSFKNAFYAIRLSGVSVAGGGRAARLTLLDERATSVKLRVTCAGLTAGSTVRLERRHARVDDKPVWAEDVTVAQGSVAKELTVEADQVARFQCVTLP
jgi:hypothetical protein